MEKIKKTVVTFLDENIFKYPPQPFKGAYGDLSAGEITLFSNFCKNAGYEMIFKNYLEGKLVFDYKGSVSGGYRNNGFSINFIKSVSDNSDFDDFLGESRQIIPTNNFQRAWLPIPKGMNKMCIMLIGTGSMNIRLKNIHFEKEVMLPASGAFLPQGMKIK